MLQVARLAPNLLRDSADLVADFVQRQLNADGGFNDRQGKSDLYYSVFGIESLVALQRDPPADAIAAYLRTFGRGDDLDLVHLGSLLRCWAGIRRNEFSDDDRARVLARLESYRTPEGGYHVQRGARHGSAYGCFVVLGAYQDLGAELPDAEGVGRCLEGLATGDGGYSNDSDLKVGNTPGTAAAVTLQHQLGLPIDRASADWLLARCHEDGGFFAMPEAPIPDLLSTATALHALSAMHAPMDSVKEKCLDFIDTLWTSAGSFYGNWTEDTLDTEYTYYGLLALGHLSL